MATSGEYRKTWDRSWDADTDTTQFYGNDKAQSLTELLHSALI